MADEIAHANGSLRTTRMANGDAMLVGARNLIDGCLEPVAGETVLVVAEDPALGWYDSDAPDCVAGELEQRGAIVRRLTVGAPLNEPIKAVQKAMNQVDKAIFFARAGDQGRFRLQYDGPRAVVSYVLNAAMLRSGYGTLSHGAMTALKDAVDEATLGARHIRVTCPLGTDFEGSPRASLTEKREVIISRYPVGVPKPVLADNFSGIVKLARYLTPTGSKVYEPAYLNLRETVTAHIDGTRVSRFDGQKSVVDAVYAHYDRVAALFDLDAYSIDSWHAGIHPLMGYDMSAADDPARWAHTVFANPRVLHFHTCGAGPPGEICWMIIDPTITIDGVALWERGRLHPERHERTNAVLQSVPELSAAMATPVNRIGVDDMA